MFCEDRTAADALESVAGLFLATTQPAERLARHHVLAASFQTRNRLC